MTPLRAPESADAALAEVQRLIRKHDPRLGELPAGSRCVGGSSSSSPENGYTYFADEAAAVDWAASLLAEDPRFEHIDELETEVWTFADHAFSEPDVDLVPEFMSRNAREVLTRTCYLPVEYLAVKAPIEVGHVRFLPLAEEEIPPSQSWFVLDPPVACVAAVVVSGTDGHRMADRARAEARYALRKLRIGLRGLNLYHERQLRFRLGGSFALNQGGVGWNRPDDSIFDAMVSSETIEQLQDEEFFAMSSPAVTDIEKLADLATSWIERALLVPDSPLVALLYLFFALEALLGNKSEGLKSHRFAVRVAMLNRVTGGGYTHPNRTFFLYDEVRSGAVHGEDSPVVDWRTVGHLAWDVRDAVNRFLRLGAQEKLVKRSRVLRYLEGHEDWPKMQEWLLEQDPKTWTKYFEKQ